MRQLINISWNNSSAVYDGSQQMNHFKPNGAANILAYAQENAPKKTKKVKAPDYRTLDQKREDTLDKKRVAFEKAFEEGSITFKQYNLLLTEWEKAMARLEKRMGLTKEEPISPNAVTKSSIINHIEDCAKGFEARYPFAFLVGSIMVGASILNVFGFGG